MISLADNGILIRGLSPQQLRAELRSRLTVTAPQSARSVWKILRAHG
jgi:hypothetical protein